MDISLEVVLVVSMIAVFAIVIAIFTLAYARNPRNRKEGKAWIFDKWRENVYDTLFKTKDAANVAKKIGVDAAKYQHNCMLCHRETQFKQIVVDKIVGFTLIIIGFVFGIAAMSPVLMAIGVIVGLPFIFFPIYAVNNATKRRRFKVADELPRFLDMLHTALVIGVPIEQAIEMTAENLKDTILGDEFLLTTADTKMGAVSWQSALEKFASDYEVDVLSDFVLDITNAYNNGTSIVDTVARESRDIKQSNFIGMKERASQLTSTILMPVLLFKIIPILALMCIPIIQQLNSSGML